MSYKTGDLLVVKPCRHETCVGDSTCEKDERPINVLDSRAHIEESLRYFTNVVCLPHSCDEWVIGGEKEILDLIVDLENAMQELRKP